MLKKILRKYLTKKQLRELINYRIKQKYLKNKNNLQTIFNKEEYINKQFFKIFGYEIDFSKKPITFTEKIQFRKIHTSEEKNNIYAECSDKCKVREYVEKKIGKKYLIPELLQTNKITLDQWNGLPNQFVIKANHNSGPVQIITDKKSVNFYDIKKEIEFQLKIDYGILTLEEYYSKISKKILVEKYLEFSGKSMQDYKFHCFGSNKIFIEHILERNENVKEEKVLKTNFYDENWNKLNFAIGSEIYKDEVKKPKNFDKMKEIAKKLSEDFDYVRVDLYNLDGRIYFGELTFCGDGGLAKFTNEKWDKLFGEFWKQEL